MVQDYEIDAWLGDAADHMTAEQISEFKRLVLNWEADHGDEDERDEILSNAAWITAHQISMSQLQRETIQHTANEVTRKAAEAYGARALLKTQVIMGLNEGILKSESEAARVAMVTRMTIRDWVGK